MPSAVPTIPIVLTFGLSDPTGGFGIQADLLTLASMGCHCVSVLTGYTVRDSASCDEVTGLDPDVVATQARMLLEDMPIAAFKIGAATRAEVVSAIAEVVSDYDDIPLILAPDFTLDDEHVLAADELRESIADLLAPQRRCSSPITPHSPHWPSPMATLSRRASMPQRLICCRRAPNTFCRCKPARIGSSTRCLAKKASCGKTSGIALLIA